MHIFGALRPKVRILPRSVIEGGKHGCAEGFIVLDKALDTICVTSRVVCQQRTQHLQLVVDSPYFRQVRRRLTDVVVRVFGFLTPSLVKPLNRRTELIDNIQIPGNIRCVDLAGEQFVKPPSFLSKRVQHHTQVLRIRLGLFQQL